MEWPNHKIITRVISHIQNMSNSSPLIIKSFQSFLIEAVLSNQTASHHTFKEPLSKCASPMKTLVRSTNWHNKWTPWLRNNLDINTMQWKQWETATIGSSWVSLQTPRAVLPVREWPPTKKNFKLTRVGPANTTMSCSRCISREPRMLR